MFLSVGDKLRRCLSIGGLVIATTAAAGIGPSGAAAVELTHEGGKPASQGETSYFFAEIEYGHVAECEGWDFGGSMGKNPSGTVKISGSDAEVSPKSCIAGVEHAGEPTNGTIAIKTAEVKDSGVKISLLATVETSAKCHYEVKKLSGVAPLGEYFFVFLSGTAKLQKKTSPKSCEKTQTVFASLFAKDAHQENYFVNP